MHLDWIDTTNLSFNALLLLERVQVSWLPGWLPERELALALHGNPAVAWYLRHKCPEISAWLDQVQAQPVATNDPQEIYAAEQTILRSMSDLLVYALDPAIYDGLPFLAWDSNELTSLVDFHDQNVLDIGAGTGRLGFTVAGLARVVFAVEPVENLRCYLRLRAKNLGFANFYAVDGLITEIPFPDGFGDICMSGHVFGGSPEDELRELERVTCPGGWVILCPGTSEMDDHAHQVLVQHAYQWSWFVEPGKHGGRKRKYWKAVD